MANSPNVWRIPFGFQLVPAGIMCLGLFTVKVSHPLTSIDHRRSSCCRSLPVGLHPKVVLRKALPILLICGGNTTIQMKYGVNLLKSKLLFVKNRRLAKALD